MSAYSRIQFCMPAGELPKFELRKHSELPVLMLTLTHENGDFTMDATAEGLRGFLLGLLAHPLLTADASTPQGPVTDLLEALRQAHQPAPHPQEPEGSSK